MGPHCLLLGELAFPTTMLLKLFIALQHLVGAVTAPLEKEARPAAHANLCIGSVACLQVKCISLSNPYTLHISVRKMITEMFLGG